MAKKLSQPPPPPPKPKKKTFRLDDIACKQLAKIQASYGMATENEAINYVLQSYLQTIFALKNEAKAHAETEDRLVYATAKIESLRNALNDVLS